MNIKWYSEAVRDLDKIYEYYELKSIRVATKLYNTIVKETEILANKPYIAAVEQILDDCPDTVRLL